MPAVLGIQAQRFVPFVRGLILRMWSRPLNSPTLSAPPSSIIVALSRSNNARSALGRMVGLVGWLGAVAAPPCVVGVRPSVVLYFLLPTMLIDRHDSILEGRKEGGSMEHGIMR